MVFSSLNGDSPADAGKRWRRRAAEGVFLLLIAAGFFTIFSILVSADSLWADLFPNETDETINARQTSAVAALASAITSLAIIGTVLIAWIAYKLQAATARRQKTIDFIYRQVHDKDIIQIFDMTRHIRRKFASRNIAINFENVVEIDNEHKRFSEDNGLPTNHRRLDSDFIMNLLNYYETWSIGIENGALDEKILCSWWRTNFVRDWTCYKDFIDGYRKSARSAGAFKKFESLAMRWANDEERPFC